MIAGERISCCGKLVRAQLSDKVRVERLSFCPESKPPTALPVLSLLVLAMTQEVALAHHADDGAPFIYDRNRAMRRSSKTLAILRAGVSAETLATAVVIRSRACINF